MQYIARHIIRNNGKKTLVVPSGTLCSLNFIFGSFDLKPKSNEFRVAGVNVVFAMSPVRLTEGANALGSTYTYRK